MAVPVVVVSSGGLAITESENGVPMTVAENGIGLAVTIVDSGGFPVALEGGTPRIALTGSSVSEGASVNAVVGTLSIQFAVDNWLGAITYSLTDDAGGLFKVSTNQLQVAAALDYETATSHSITVQATNGIDAPITRTFTITVIDVDEVAPTITSSSTVNQPENAALSHALTANEAVTWTKTGGADAALFTLSGSTLSLPAQDYETPADGDGNNTYVVQVTATDTAGNATNQTITVTITDVDEGGGGGEAGSPIGLLLSLTKAA